MKNYFLYYSGSTDIPTIKTKEQLTKEINEWLKKKKKLGWLLGKMMHNFNLSIQEAKAYGSTWTRGQSGLHRKLQTRKSYIMRPCLKKRKKKQKKIKKKRNWAEVMIQQLSALVDLT